MSIPITHQITPATIATDMDLSIGAPDLLKNTPNKHVMPFDSTVDGDAIMNKLIPFSFDSLKESVISKVRNALNKVDKALNVHTEAKDRVKELRVIGAKLGFDLNRKSEEFLLVEAAAITNISMRDEGKSFVQDEIEFLTEFPEFGGLPSDERETLLHYRNIMKISMQVIPAKWNYNHLLALVARVAEGCKVKYVTGSGATDQTKYRMMIYEKLSGIPRQKRPEKQYEPLMDMLKGNDKIRHEASNSSLSSSDSGTNSFYSFTDLPVREKSYVVTPGLYVDSKEADFMNGALLRSSSLTRKVDNSSSGNSSSIEREVSRSASVTSNGFIDIDHLPLFENMHEEMDFSFLESTELGGSYQLDHQSVYTDTGLMKHDISITEYMEDDSSHQEDKTTSFYPNSLVATLSVDDTGSSSCVNTRKRKANSGSAAAGKGQMVKKVSPNQEERYNCLIEKLSECIFHKEAPGQHPGESNYIFIKEILQPRLPELEEIVAKETNANQVTKKMKKLASSLGVDPLSRFNDKFLIVEISLVLLLSSRAERQNLKISFDEFLREQPEFRTCDQVEQESLHTYRNMLAAALEVIPGKWNSNHLLDVVTRIVEGKDKKHVTGSGATRQTRNRIDVYHNLTGIEKQHKPVTFVNSVFQYLSDSANSSASSSDEKGNEAEENAGFWPGPSTQKVMKNFGTSLGIAEKKKKRRVDTNMRDENCMNNIDGENGDENLSSTSVSMSGEEESAGQLEIKKVCHSVPNLPEVKVSRTEMSSSDSSVSCKATSVFREMTDAVTGVSFTFELARGVSVTQHASGSFDLFDNLDLFCDIDGTLNDSLSMDVSSGTNISNVQRQASRDRSEFDMQCLAMLQEHGQSGVQLHRGTSGTANGIIRNISLTRQISNETTLMDNFGQSTDILSLVRSQSIMPVNRDSSFHLLSPERDHSLIKLI